MEIVILFIFFLFGTLLVNRFGAYKLHDMENYDSTNSRNSKAKTITGVLRRKTGFDWHHIHFGIVLLLAVIPCTIFFGLTKLLTILLAIGLSMVADQITPLIDRKSNYFSREKLLISVMFHIILVIAFLILRINFS